METEESDDGKRPASDATCAADYTAVLLLAGCGTRIGTVTDEPKSLLPVAGLSILHRHLRAFARVGIRKVVLVVGYRKDLVVAEARSFESGPELTVISNDDYQNKGNGYSLYMGIEAAAGPVVIFDGDLVYSPEVLRRFVESGKSNGVVVGAARIDDIECTKALVDDDSIVRRMADKRAVSDDELADFRFAGEAFGMLKFDAEQRLALIGQCERFFAEPKNLPLNWEYLLASFLIDRDVVSEFEESRDWVEIDTPEDYELAQSKAERLD